MKGSIEQYLQLEEDLRRYRVVLNKALDIMMEQDLSNYPIFILHQLELEMGVKLIQADSVSSQWSVHASSLEEFSMKSLIEVDKISEFQRVYKEHPNHFCLFVLSEMGAQFIFYPRDEQLYKEYGTLN